MSALKHSPSVPSAPASASVPAHNSPSSSSSSSASSSPSSPSTSEWPDKAVSALLRTYTDKFCAERGYLRNADWEEVARNVNSACHNLKVIKTLKQCKDKLDSLKRRYKSEKRKAINGGEIVWPFFHTLDAIMNSVLKQGRSSAVLPLQRHSHSHGAGSNGRNDGGNNDANNGGNQQKEDLIEYSNSHNDVADSPLCSEDDRLAAERLQDLSDDGLHAYSSQPQQRRKDLFNGRGVHGDHHQHHISNCGDHQRYMFDGENSYQYPHLGHLPLLYHASIRQGTLKSTEIYPPPTLKRAAKRGKLEGKNDIKALADLSVSKVLSSKSSFSIMISRIEEAKTNIFTKMNSELAKLEKIGDKKRKLKVSD